MSYDITGKISVIFDEMQVSATFKKREFVIEVEDDKYPEFIKLEAIQDKTDLLNNFSIGQEVAVSFNLKGRKWTDPKTQEVKYFNSHHAWKIEAVGEQQPAAPQSYTAPPEITPAPAITGNNEPPMDESQDIPFNKLGDFEQ